MRKILEVVPFLALGTAFVTSGCGPSANTCYDAGASDCLAGFEYLPLSAKSTCLVSYDQGWLDADCSNGVEDSGSYDTGW